MGDVPHKGIRAILGARQRWTATMYREAVIVPIAKSGIEEDGIAGNRLDGQTLRAFWHARSRHMHPSTFCMREDGFSTFKVFVQVDEESDVPIRKHLGLGLVQGIKNILLHGNVLPRLGESGC